MPCSDHRESKLVYTERSVVPCSDHRESKLVYRKVSCAMF